MTHSKELNERSPLRAFERSIHGGLGEGNLVVGRPAVLVEPERDRPEPAAGLGRQRGERRRVAPGREEHADVDVGHQPRLHGLPQHLLGRVLPVPGRPVGAVGVTIPGHQLQQAHAVQHFGQVAQHRTQVPGQ